MSLFPPREVVCGVQLHVQTKTRTLREPWEDQAGVAELATIADKAEEIDLAYIGVCDHVAIPDNDYARHMSTTWFDTVATLGFLAARTSRIRLLSNVFIPGYRHPLHVAKAFMTLDHLSGGRVILGVGVGHVEAEFDALGVDYLVRGRLLDESIDAVRVSFAEEWTSFQGQEWKWEQMGQAPRPVQQPVPIWVGGRGRPALRRVAERGDGWIPQGTPRAQMAGDVAYIREVADRVRPDARLDLGFMSEWIYVGQPDWDLGPAPHLTGSPESIAESLRYAHELGCSHVQVRLRSRSLDELLDQMDAFGRDVLPLVR